MPYKQEWVPAELAVEHNGVKIYHAYNEDNYDGRMSFWFMANREGNFYEDAFDVRELPNYDSASPVEFIIIEAIEQGYLSQEGLTIKAAGI